MVGALVSVGLFLGMLLLLEVGRRMGSRRLAEEGEGAKEGLGAVEGAIFGLLGLLIAFTFSGAVSRFDDRRRLVAEEANAIGTAYLRLDVLPVEARAVLQEKFRQYLDSRLLTYRKLPDIAAARAQHARSVALQGEIWAQAVASVASGPPSAPMLLLPALNEMIDITTTREMATLMHPPTVVFAMLAALALMAALLAGYAMAGSRTRHWHHMLGFAAIMAATVYVILDLEYPRLGLIRVDAADRVLVELRQGMN